MNGRLRNVIAASGAVASFLCHASCTTQHPPRAPETVVSHRCAPGLACWPSGAEWEGLRASLTGTLEKPQSPLLPCTTDAASAACSTALTNMKNPFFIDDQVGGTQSQGWLGAWTPARSEYAVVVANAQDVAAAVRFARAHDVRLVVKGTGHDPLGRSSAPGSLLVWTHTMRRVDVHEAFAPQGCGREGVPAVTVEAGARWLEAYQEVTVKHGRYVQGGGCTSVGAAGGFTQGGGFGSWSRKYGTSAGEMLEAEVVVADGRVLVANDCQNQDLFWALRGGGGGTFGIVTKMTLRTQSLPNYFGWVNGRVRAASDAAFKDLLERFLLFYGEKLNNELWGKQVKVRGDNSLEVSMSFLGMTAKEAEEVWQPFRAWIDQRSEAFTMNTKANAIPGTKMWDYAYIKARAPDVIETDERPGQPPGQFWWKEDEDAASIVRFAYHSRWIPVENFRGERARAFADALFQASRAWPVTLNFSKGQAGAAADAVRRGRETSMNPALYEAAALAVVKAGVEAFPGVTGHEPSLEEGARSKERVDAAMGAIRRVTEDAGAYANEADYFEPNWQHAFWGSNYERLLGIKKKYDPRGLFTCHHCVGSELQEHPR